MFKQRIGPDPHLGGEQTGAAGGCPDVWELESGDFAVIGIEKTGELRPALPPTASCGSDEAIVVIPRALLYTVRKHLPNE